MEKQKTTVRVAGKDYALVSTDSPEHLNRVAAYVDRQMTETMRSGRIPANTAAVLTALNLADDLMRAQDEVNRLRRELALLREKAVKASFNARLQGIGYFARFIMLMQGISPLRRRPKGNGNGRSPRSPFETFACTPMLVACTAACGYGGTVWVSCG